MTKTIKDIFSVLKWSSFFFLDLWQEILDDCLAHVEPEIQVSIQQVLSNFSIFFHLL